MKTALVIISSSIVLLVVFFHVRPMPVSVLVSTTPAPSVVQISPSPATNTPEFVEPIAGFSSRVTKKPFGIYITSANSPVQPERFSGFHTGADAEIFPGEEEIDVSITAACSGKLLSARTASGYGGVIVQSCSFQNQPVTVLYGHIRITSIKVNVGDYISKGDFLGFLGTGETDETDGERKHLHFAIHRGAEINFSGYVSAALGLSSWIDPIGALSPR